MDSETVHALFEEGAVLVVDGVPANTEFGIDYNCWRTGDKFKGVKMIPPGCHYIYWSSTDPYGNVAMRNGFFYNFKLNELVFKKWDTSMEGIDVSHQANAQDVARIKANKYDLDRFLGPYPYEQYKKWVSLSDRLTIGFVDRLMPDAGSYLCFCILDHVAE
jgi:A1 cistron-splicing factor AAR2